MNLRVKTLLAIGIAMIVLLVVQQSTTRPGLLEGFRRSEAEFLTASAGTVGRLLASEVMTFHERFADWSNWDDLFEFAQHPSDVFVQSNLEEESLDLLRVNAAAVFSHEKGLVFARGYESHAGAGPLPPSLARRFEPGAEWTRMREPDRALSGLLLVDGRLMMISLRPILRSDLTGPSTGVLLMARYLEGAQLSRLSDLVGGELRCRVLLSADSARPPVWPPAVNWDDMGAGEASWSISGIGGGPVAALSIRMPARIFEHGLLTTRLNTLWILAAGLAFGIVVMLTMEGMVLRRVSRLDVEVEGIGHEGGPTRVTVGADDELGRLATSINRTLEALRTAQVQAEAASRAKSDFLANMSHEIRTPMTAILGFAAILGEMLDDDPAKREHIRTIRRNGEHLLAIIDDILDLSKIEAERMTLEKVPCSPVAIVEDVASLLGVRAKERGLELKVEHRWPLPASIRCDPLRLRQIIMNLVSNGIKFTERGGVTIRTLATGPEGTGELVVEVADSGIGMNAEGLSRLFRPFTQADETMSRRFGGTGLGLTISRRLARLMNGDIDVRSSPGSGSVFILRVPYAGDAMASGPADLHDTTSDLVRAVDRPSPAQGARVLLAEDGPDNQRLLRFHLRRAGVEVEVADNGKAAIDAVERAAAQQRPFDLVLMDMQMPELDGYEATRILRRSGFTAPVIALTAHAMGGDREKCLSAGCSAYLTKPFESAQLLDLVAFWLQQSRSPGRGRDGRSASSAAA
ncbi:MAG: ATP-binding protein [Planctomycetota bacterium]|nr:ATP-binding protein [Planctomycetota bacterium]